MSYYTVGLHIETLTRVRKNAIMSIGTMLLEAIWFSKNYPNKQAMYFSLIGSKDAVVNFITSNSMQAKQEDDGDDGHCHEVEGKGKRYWLPFMTVFCVLIVGGSR